MINAQSKIKIILVCWIIILISVTASHGVLTLETDQDEILIQKQVTLSNNREKVTEDNSNFRKKICKIIEEFLIREKNDYGNYKKKDEETNQLKSNKIENEINLNNWTKYFSIVSKNNETFQRPSNSNEKLTNKINQNTNEENDSNDLILSRNIRSINKTDYYAQRKAVMDKFHARQREITTKYGKKYLNNTSKIVHTHNQTLNVMKLKNTNDPNLDIFKVASNNSFFGTELNRINQGEKDTEKKEDEENTEKKRSWISDNSIRDITNYTSKLNNRIKQGEENTEKKRSWISDNSLRDVINYTLSNNANCSNIILHDTYSNRARNQLTVSCLDNKNESIVEIPNKSPASRPIRATDGNLIWGTCNGTLVYQHNFALNINGPSILEAIFEVIVDGPLCITCVTILPYNDTKENVVKESGGEGYTYVKIKFKNSENKGFSYIIKIWAVQKTDDNCT
ncbi:hypothetical protein M0802_012928 [Mischocyttarus mexicanus]|nr:hypothetical protein M0802_012928 [Mischocyttarus mexicanus]